MPTTTKQIVIIGDGAVGKTCLLHCYTNELFLEDYVPTIFDKEVIGIVIKGVEHKVKLIDTAGQEDYERLRKTFYNDADAFIICYDVSNRDSFQNIKSMWLPEIKKTCKSRWPIPFVLVATKSDLRKNSKKPLISTEEGELMCRQILANRFVECSAKTNYHIQMAIHEALRAAVNGPIFGTLLAAFENQPVKVEPVKVEEKTMPRRTKNCVVCCLL